MSLIDERSLQRALQAAGFYRGKIDGDFGDGSRRAAREMASQRGHRYAPGWSDARVRLAVEQAVFTDAGLNPGVIDGLMGPNTQAAATEWRKGHDEAVPTVAAGSTFDRSLRVILRHEGGFVNHPKDPGGMTNLGVTKRTLEDWTGRKVTEAEMRALTPATVAPIYRKNYWDKLRCDDLPPGLALCVFDFGVNAGPARAGRYLQKLVGVAQDGAVGDGTIAAAKAWAARVGPATAVSAFQDARRGYYRQLGTFPTFGRGWLRRVDEVEAEARKL